MVQRITARSAASQGGGGVPGGCTRSGVGPAQEAHSAERSHGPWPPAGGLSGYSRPLMPSNAVRTLPALPGEEIWVSGRPPQDAPWAGGRKIASCPSSAGQWLAAKVWGRIHCGERFPDPKEACPETEELFLYKGDRNNSLYGLFFPLREPPSYNLWFAQPQHLQAFSPAPYCFLPVVPCR